MVLGLTLSGWGNAGSTADPETPSMSRPSGELPNAGAPLPKPATLDEEALHRLMADLTREPRIIGTPGYDRALTIVEDTLTRAGLKPTRKMRKSGRAIPTRSDVLLFEDGTQNSAFAGLRERWDPTSIPTMPRPMAYDHNPAEADVRGMVVPIGAGLDADFERVAGFRIDVTGAILLAEMELAPSARVTSVRAIAERAAAAGAAGLLIAPLPSDGLSALEARSLWVRENTIHKAPLALPVAPIRRLEAEALLQRLRTKRVRGEDGKAVPMRIGPGPVEASITIECPLVLLEAVTELRIVGALATGKPRAVRRVPVNGLCDRPLHGAFELTAEMLSLARGHNAETQALRKAVDGAYTPEFSLDIAFGPFAVAETHALLGPDAPFTAATPPSAAQPKQRPALTTWIPGRFDRLEDVISLLGKELSIRMDAAARFIAYDAELMNYGGDLPPTAASWQQISQLASDTADVLRRHH